MKEKEQHVTEDTGRCLDVTPSAAARHLAPYRVSRSGQDGRPRTYCHRDYFAVYYVERGYVTLTADGADLRLAYGDIAIVPPRLPHTLTLCTDKTDIYECSFTIGLIEDILKNRAGTGGTLSRLFNGGAPVVIQPVPADLQIHLQHLMELILYEAERQGPLPIVKNALATLLCVFSELYRAQEEAPEAAEKSSVVYAIHYIRRNYASPLTLDMLASVTRMSRKELCRRFKRFTGKTVHEFISGVRIKRALEVIAAEETPPALSALATLCGYTDYTTFYRNFQKIVGTSPAEYLALRQEGSKTTEV